MNPSRNRGRKILELAIQNKENCSEPEASTSNLNNLPTTSNYTYPADKENLCDEDDGDFSPASDDDKTYAPSKKTCRRSSSSSSSSLSSSSSSSSSSKSSVSSSTSIAPDPPNICQATTQSTNVSDNNLAFVNDCTELISNNQSSGNVDNNIAVDIAPAVDSNNQSAGNEANNIVVDIPPAADNIEKSRKKKKNQRVSYISKTLKDCGKEYVSCSKTKKVFPAKFLKPTCESTCRLKCSERITGDLRKQIFEDYWGMASLVRQREYIAHNMEEIIPKYQYKRVDSNRKLKNAFYFNLNGTRTKVCKTFFKNTLDITDRCIKTVIEKKNSTTGILKGEKEVSMDSKKST